MSHLAKEKLELVSRSKKIIGQMESVLRGLEEDAHCAEVLQRLSAARGAINSLMGELMEDHIRNHMPRKTKSSAEAAEDLVEIVRTYLK
ncbi:MAG TPA: metal/formaldehyde-sensitive transcriptional repressor [Candidatus Baltobacteraceae bacterium]|jgi:DNA-binding FrmR family transcriptional regulator|nr:metal/formaldehyde-sensitive transcriptional repressor [Candidatus Baltobacteraceae bacterium]